MEINLAAASKKGANNAFSVCVSFVKHLLNQWTGFDSTLGAERVDKHFKFWC